MRRSVDITPGPPPLTGPSFREVYADNFTYVWNSLRRLGVLNQDLEDLAQETFEDVFNRLDTYDSSRPLRPWLFGVALRVVLDHRKRLRRRRESLVEVDQVDPRPAADHLVELSQESQLVMRALETLEIQRRAVFVMSELGGHTMPEIAETLAVPVNTAYSRLRLARHDFEIALRRLQPPRRAP